MSPHHWMESKRPWLNHSCNILMAFAVTKLLPLRSSVFNLTTPTLSAGVPANVSMEYALHRRQIKLAEKGENKALVWLSSCFSAHNWQFLLPRFFWQMTKCCQIVPFLYACQEHVRGHP